METYHRKRSKRSAINMNNEIMSLKRQDTSSVLDGGTPPLARQLLLDTNYKVPDEEVELGSVYEVYHKNLPPRTPVQLRSTRVVMVSEKTELNVAIRYPSILSLRTYFSNGIMEMYPALDEKFVMGTKLARKVLLRQVPSQEFAEKKHLESFWLVNPNSQFGSNVVLRNEDIGLARELKKNMVRWGVRRQVMFIGKHLSNSQSSSSFVQEEEEEEVKHEPTEIKGDEYDQEEMEVDDHEADQEDDDDEAEEDEEEEEEETLYANLERKLKSTRKLRKRKKANKQVNHLWQVNKKPMKKCKKLALRDPTDRWSKERYMAAELSLLEAMKEKKAMIGNPITRPALRIEARKRIGDTGLLDHLLKHVANKVAPGGNLRFRRSHNADGAMEYWLEDADLLKIRKDAGVNDPFWTPPLGWKPGDSPIQDPIVAKEINHLKEEISTIKERVTLSQKHFDEELASLRREIEGLTSKNKQDQSQAIVVSEQAVDMSPKQVTDISNFMLLSEPGTTDVESSTFSREKCRKQISVISAFLKKIEAWMDAEVGKETTQMIRTDLINTPTVSDTKKESEKLKVAEKNEAHVQQLGLPKEPAGDQQLQLATSEESGRKFDTPTAEGKAAKIERLKSGFRLCRPQGTFLWPNMVNHHPTTTTTSSSAASCCLSNMSSSSQQVEVVPTPPSVNSSTPPQLPSYHHHHNLLSRVPSPVKPVPERRPVTLTVAAIPETHPHLSNSTTTSSLINLNDIPSTNPSTQHMTPSTHHHNNDEISWEAAEGNKKTPSSVSSVWIADSQTAAS